MDEPSPEALAAAQKMVARWEHGSDEHRQWLRDMCVPEIATALVAERRAAIEECARVADSFRCGGCGMDGKAGAAIRALAPEKSS